MHIVPTGLLPQSARALYAQGINMVEELRDDEEEEFLRINQSVVLVFDIDVERIIEQYRDKKSQQNSADSLESDTRQGEQDDSESEQKQKMHLKQIFQAEKAY